MADSFANVYDAFRTMEAAVDSAVDSEPLYD
jgi:hypothetical protein